MIITGSAGGGWANGGRWWRSHRFTATISDIAESTLEHSKISAAAVRQPRGSSPLCLGPNHPGGPWRRSLAASGNCVTAAVGGPVCSHGCRRELGGHFQSSGDPGAQDQNEEEALRATEGEGVSSQRPDPECLYVGRQSLGESLEADTGSRYSPERVAWLLH